MAKKKIPAPHNPDDDREIDLLRLEVRTEMVALSDEEKVERLTACAGLEAEISDLEREQTDLDESRKALRTSIDAKIAHFRAAVREAHAGHKGADYDVIVERHPDRPAEMMVWRCPDGLDGIDLLEEQPGTGETSIQLRERQGCLLVESRAMSPEELRAADLEDDKRRNPPLPLEGLDAPPAPADGPVDPFDAAPRQDGQPLEEGNPLEGEPLKGEELDLDEDLRAPEDKDDDDWIADPPPAPAQEPKKRGRKAKA